MVQGLRATYDRALAVIQEDILRLGTRVTDAISNALESLQRRDQVLAQAIIEADDETNVLRFKIEEACLALIATQQPTAKDLRAVMAAMSIVVDLERMADHAVGIAKTVILMGDEPLLKPLIDVPRMAKLAKDMLHDVLKAYVNRDAERARDIARRDDEMDQLYRAVYDELVEIMADKPGNVERATYLMWCAHNLERIGDRVTNIAERVVFVSTGDMQELNV
ncbi:MAG: phosphate signaling complex protein PhoU [Anaerolineales bacterium]|nr:phosphate signaling complex protein PhoU [Anaerolineales bacterium]